MEPLRLLFTAGLNLVFGNFDLQYRAGYGWSIAIEHQCDVVLTRFFGKTGVTKKDQYIARVGDFSAPCPWCFSVVHQPQ